MHYKLFFILTICCSTLLGQELKMEWTPDYQMTIEDFKGPQTKINEVGSSVYVQSGVSIEFAIQMSNFEFMFTKNFNSKITCTFQKDAATLIAPDSIRAKQLVDLVQYDFDLSELYSRKIRKELFENKKTFSNVSFFQPYFDKMIAERNAVSSKMYKDTDFATNTSLLEKKHKEVLKEILLLSDYCKACKPRKKRKN